METEVLKSWNENADEWIRAMDENKIPSRKITNRAITKVLSELSAGKILDCGCGEGWLCRSMSKIGKKSVGIDATPKLIKRAQSKGSEAFYIMSYTDISRGVQIPETPFGTAVFNFSLYQKEGLTLLLKNIKKSISKNGFMVIQTMHPYLLKQQNLSYESQWISDSWKGLSANFKNGHAWYARTFEDWSAVFASCELQIKDRIEVKDFENSLLSVIFVLSTNQ